MITVLSGSAFDCNFDFKEPRCTLRMTLCKSKIWQKHFMIVTSYPSMWTPGYIVNGKYYTLNKKKIQAQPSLVPRPSHVFQCFMQKKKTKKKQKKWFFAWNVEKHGKAWVQGKVRPTEIFIFACRVRIFDQHLQSVDIGKNVSLWWVLIKLWLCVHSSLVVRT